MIFSKIAQNPYPILGAFAEFTTFDTTAPQLDTTVGQTAKSDQNPYPIPEAFHKFDENDTNKTPLVTPL